MPASPCSDDKRAPIYQLPPSRRGGREVRGTRRYRAGGGPSSSASGETEMLAVDLGKDR